jgi:uncharacterized membrane protein
LEKLIGKGAVSLLLLLLPPRFIGFCLLVAPWFIGGVDFVLALVLVVIVACLRGEFEVIGPYKNAARKIIITYKHLSPVFHKFGI